ncbi:hypothetical protein AZ09_11625 [Acetobacter aceti 1023]|nr:hypothetical protein AZ09_11625 [Acetobacter aceti 1023]
MQNIRLSLASFRLGVPYFVVCLLQGRRFFLYRKRTVIIINALLPGAMSRSAVRLILAKLLFNSRTVCMHPA